jgi:hypothetical protein
VGLSQIQKAPLAKVRAVGNSGLAVPVGDEICTYLLGIVVQDLGLRASFPVFAEALPAFFGTTPLSSLRVEGLNFIALFEQLVDLRQDADSYFLCLATLHKARLKYERILQAQPIPTIDQVGPRGLLQFGSLNPGALAALPFLAQVDFRHRQPGWSGNGLCV